jgi:hypothetical protein
VPLSLHVAAAASLPPTPLARTLVRRRIPSATTNRHPPTHPAHVHPCAPATPDEPEVVAAPLAEALLVLLIEPAEENFMCGCGGAAVGRGIDLCWGNVIGVCA